MIESHKTLAEKFLKKGFWLYLFSFIIAPLWYTIRILLSWDLTVSEVWVLYWIISLMMLISSYNDLWMTESIKYFIPKFLSKNRYDKVKSVLFYALACQFISSLILSLFFFFTADFLAINYFKDPSSAHILKIFILFLMWINIFQTINSFFIAVQDTFWNRFVDFLRMLFVLIMVLYFFIWDMGSLESYSISRIVWLYVWISVSLIVFYILYFKKYFSWIPILLDKKLFKKVFSYAIFVLMGSWLWTILWQMDLQMVIFFLWTQQWWFYSNYLSIFSICTIVLWPIFMFLFPVFSELHSKNDISKIRIAKKVLSEFFILSWIFFSIFFFVFAKQIALVLFWSKFIESGLILQFSILFLVLYLLMQLSWNLMAWIWRAKERLKIVSIAIVFNFFLNIIMIKFMGSAWAALSTWLWWTLILILFERDLWKGFYVDLNIKLIFTNLICFSLLWFLFYRYMTWLIEHLGRLEIFWFLFLFVLIWLWFFILINYKLFKGFILEVKKLKAWLWKK